VSYGRRETKTRIGALDGKGLVKPSGARRLRADGAARSMNQTVRGRQYAEYFAFRLTAAMAAALPLEVASRLSGLGWRLVAPRLGRHQRALDALAFAFPEMSAAERQRIAVAMWDNLGRTFAEFFHIKRIVEERRIAL
jgi:Kdo2-lipid IVA lauroyltransferase/acyltransferase